MWVQDQLAAGQTMAQIQDYLKTFDVQDRYDSDVDGNYDEPDGFIDHFQIVHAGGDEAAGDPTYGHRRDLEPPLLRQPAARWPERAASA